jgi:rod shape-determining protein MreD
MRRFVVLALVMLTAVIIQTSLFARVTLFGVSPDLILVVVISLALLEGPSTGAASGLGGGLLRDFLLEAPKGLTGLAYLIVGYAVGSVRPYVQSTSVFLPVSAMFVGSLAASSLYVILSLLLGRQLEPWDRVAQVILFTAVYNMLLAPFVFPLVRRVSAMYPREKVYRW